MQLPCGQHDEGLPMGCIVLAWLHDASFIMQRGRCWQETLLVS